MRTTYMAKPGEVERKWYVIDATDIALGRLSTVVASILRGKINQHLHLTLIQVITSSSSTLKKLN